MLRGRDDQLRRYLYLGERGEWRRRPVWSCFPCRLVAKNLGLHAVRSGRVCGLVRWLSGVTHSNEFQGDSPYKIGVVGCARSVMVVVLCFAAVLVSRVLGACVLCSSSYTYSGPHRHQRGRNTEHRPVLNT